MGKQDYPYREHRATTRKAMQKYPMDEMWQEHGLAKFNYRACIELAHMSGGDSLYTGDS